MSREFSQITWNGELERACRELLARAKAEDLQQIGDITTRATVPEGHLGQGVFRLRESGVIAGIPVLAVAAQVYDSRLVVEPLVNDGSHHDPETDLARVLGPAAGILAMERPALNLLSRLSGIASQTRRWVELIKPHRCAIYDTRKTTPGLRLLEKYAVRCGGGRNHRSSLSDAILIKDNHLALGGRDGAPLSPAEAVRRAREFCQRELLPEHDPIIEIEVDTWHQFVEAIDAEPDLILLDNLSAAQLRRAVQHRNAHAPQVQLEASGHVTPTSLPDIAASGVERVSIGALTHSAVQLDIGLDWQ